MIIDKTAFLYVVAKLAEKNKGTISKFHASLMLFLCDKHHMEEHGYTFTNYGYYLNKDKVPLAKELQKCIAENFDFFSYYFEVKNEEISLTKEFDDKEVSYEHKYAYAGSMSDLYLNTFEVIFDIYGCLDFDSLQHLCNSSFQEFTLENEIKISDMINQLDIEEEYKVDMIAEHDYHIGIDETFENL